MIRFLGFPARDMFWTGKYIKYDELLEIFQARDTFWTVKWIKCDKLLGISS